MIARSLIITALLILPLGCHGSSPPAATTLTAPAATAFEKRVHDHGSDTAFEKRVHDHGSATFRSWNGRAYRMDSDTELAFRSDGTVQMLEWGDALGYYAGRYEVHPDGFVSAWFEDYQLEWPTMRIEGQGDSLSLRPFDEENGFMSGNRGASTRPPTQDGFWPLRMLTGNEEADVLKIMKGQQDAQPQPTSTATATPQPAFSAAAVIYRDGEYGFTFILPADWQNYSVRRERWESKDYNPRLDRDVVVASGPIIVLRHPLWTPASPRQDIPILVFTRKEWRENRQEGIFAGGVVDEIAHNDRYVFAVHSRFNANDSVEGSDEAGQIVSMNATASAHLDRR